jgi:hypothetical protein
MIKFKELTEASGQGGFDYEKVINDKLKKHGKADKNQTTAGASADAPDAKFQHGGVEHNIEIKADHKAMFGQIELKHDGEKWDVSERSKIKYPHTYKAIHKSGFIDKVNHHWGKPSGDYDKDLKMGNIYHDHHDAEPIKAHYGKDRNTNYIQIGGGHGFYHTGKDSASLGSPELDGQTQMRARMKYRGTDAKTGKKKYGALVVMALKNAPKSHHNLDADVHKEWIDAALYGPKVFSIAEGVEIQVEARMTAAMKLQRAFQRQQEKSAASRARAAELLNPKKKETDVDNKKEVNEAFANRTDKPLSKRTTSRITAHVKAALGKTETSKHRIRVTLSEPDHPMVSKRKETIQKHIRVSGVDTKDEAESRAISHYRKKGYKVHSAEHVGMVKEEVGKAVPTADAPKMVRDRKTGELYDPNKKFKELMDKPETKGVMKRLAKEEVDLDEMTQGKEYTQAQLQKKIQSGNWEATHDIKPGKHVEMRHHTGKKVMVQVKEEVEHIDEDAPLKHHTAIVSYRKNGDPHRRYEARFKTTHNGGKEETEKRVKTAFAAKGRSVYNIVHEEVEYIDEGAYEKSEENKRSADAAKKQGDMFAHHLHMADHHENLSQWHSSKGRHNEADKHAEKAEEHQDLAMKHKVKKEEVEQIDELSKKTLSSYAKSATSSMRGVATSAQVTGSLDRDDPHYKKYSDRTHKRIAGVEKAVDRLAKEEVAANNVGDGKIAGTQGDAGKKSVMTKPVLKRKVIDFKEFVENLEEGKPGLWANIHAKRKRIANGSGERMRKPGSKGAPTAQDFKDSQSKNEDVEAQFDMIEEMIEELALLNNVDSEKIWEDLESIDDEELLEAAIDAKGHKSSTGGLTQKGVDAYNRKTGGNLQTAVTTPPSKLKPGSKAANRRKSFCARMGGMKKRLTSSKTANDPDSRINKALRKWNC